MFKIFLTTLVLTVFTFADASLLKTGQTSSYDEYGNVVTDGSVRDDGFYQMGKTRSYSRSVVGVVRDNVTKLEWQDDVDSVLKQWLTDANYYDGNYNDTSGDTAATFCSDLTLDGGGWRLPSTEELETLSDNGTYSPSVTENVFEHISTSDYWSATTNACGSSAAWQLSFGIGNSSSSAKVNGAYVRCVRGGQLEPSNFSRDDMTEIVTDSTTGLQWQDNEIVERTWQEAIDYCENDMALGGYSNWRLPNLKELLSLADRSQCAPGIDTVFVNTSSSPYSSYYWSSTASAIRTNDAWIVPFGLGYSHSNRKYVDEHYVRCIRGGQFDTSAFLPPVIMYLLN